MTQSARRDSVEIVEIVERDLGGAPGAHESERTLELCAPLRVGGVLEAALDPRVDDHERGPLRNRYDAMLEGRAVEQDRGAIATEHARSLVEDPAGYADRSQLGSLAGECELDGLELELRDGAEREGDGDLERSG